MSVGIAGLVKDSYCCCAKNWQAILTSCDAGWRPQVESARAAFDAGLRAALDGALLLLQPPASSGAGTSADTSAAAKRRFSFPTQAPQPASGRAAELEPFVQDR